MSHTAWKMVFDSLWKTFNLRFQGILESLRKHRDLIDQEANSVDIAEAKAWRRQQLGLINTWRAERAEETDRLERDRQTSATRAAMTWIGAGEEQEDQFAKVLRASNDDHRHWALEEAKFMSWLAEGKDLSTVLWLNGKPGAGM